MNRMEDLNVKVGEKIISGGVVGRTVDRWRQEGSKKHW